MKKFSITALALGAMIFQAGAQNTFPYPSTGSIGIGTTTIAGTNKLQVGGNVGISGNLGIGVASTANQFDIPGKLAVVFHDGIGKVLVGNTDPNTHVAYHDGSQVMVLKSNLAPSTPGGFDPVGTTLKLENNLSKPGSLFIGVAGCDGCGSGFAKVGDSHISTDATGKKILFIGKGTSTTSNETTLQFVSRYSGITTEKQYLRMQANGLTLVGDAPTAAEQTALDLAVNCTTSPALKLWVNGTVGTKEINVNMSSWCDYVFENDYKLRPLNEVEQYIQANKHLPEVPSENQVTAQGMAVGEMMKVHMKKIEELTLYVIEQNKRIAELEANAKK